ncbi:MAG: hypothetical protein P9L92_17590 [Candidatus Electryonea clarkiae]|nr:hypothetical protein [Candidatus Electryonea clarkiae]MDP8287032.1 hypothetical protein [Candidatus Electryonea clarkiae]
MIFAFNKLLGTIDRVIGDFWVIINNVTDKPNVFILKPEEVKELVHRGEKEDRVSYWLQPREYETDEFRDKWERIGFGE